MTGMRFVVGFFLLSFLTGCGGDCGSSDVLQALTEIYHKKEAQDILCRFLTNTDGVEIKKCIGEIDQLKVSFDTIRTLTINQDTGGRTCEANAHISIPPLKLGKDAQNVLYTVQPTSAGNFYVEMVPQ